MGIFFVFVFVTSHYSTLKCITLHFYAFLIKYFFFRENNFAINSREYDSVKAQRGKKQFLNKNE